MPNIKPISDLRNYNEVLRDVEEGSPVFLTKNGRGKYAIVELRDYEKAQATIRLMSEIAKGRRSGEEKGCLTSEEMRAHFRARAKTRHAVIWIRSGIILHLICKISRRRKDLSIKSWTE